MKEDWGLHLSSLSTQSCPLILGHLNISKCPTVSTCVTFVQFWWLPVRPSFFLYTCPFTSSPDKWQGYSACGWIIVAVVPWPKRWCHPDNFSHHHMDTYTEWERAADLFHSILQRLPWRTVKVDAGYLHLGLVSVFMCYYYWDSRTQSRHDLNGGGRFELNDIDWNAFLALYPPSFYWLPAISQRTNHPATEDGGVGECK